MALTAETIASRIQHAIEAAGLTQQAVADAIEMDPTALCKALAGTRRFTSLEIARLCEALKVSPLALLDDGTPPPDPSEANAARVRWLADLSETLTRNGYPVRRDHRYPATLLDRAVEAWLAGHISIRPVAGIIGMDADTLLEQVLPEWRS